MSSSGHDEGHRDIHPFRPRSGPYQHGRRRQSDRQFALGFPSKEHGSLEPSQGNQGSIVMKSILSRLDEIVALPGQTAFREPLVAFDNYLGAERNFSARTRQGYFDDLSTFIYYLSEGGFDKGPEGTTADTIRDFLAWSVDVRRHSATTRAR